VELLVTMVVISILATTVLFAMFGAQEAARRAKTRATVDKIHGLLMDRFESYRTRRVAIDTSGLSPKQAAAKRLVAARALMRMEMPERWADITDGPGAIPPGNTFYIPPHYNQPFRIPAAPVLTEVPAISKSYRRRYLSNSKATPQFEGAECLYMIVTMGAEDETSGVELFRTSEIGDYDGDGMKEFLDGWGRPISFLRWAPGFTDHSQIQKEAEEEDGERDPAHADPLNPWGIRQTEEEPLGYALFPLIFSAGPDGEWGLIVANTATTYADAGILNNPFLVSTSIRIGSPDPDNPGAHLDNIHSHLIEVN
jgi:hypothetical protein